VSLQTYSRTRPRGFAPWQPRAAVTSGQVARYSLPSAPAKRSDKRGDFTGETVQAEALPPDVLAAEVASALASILDEDARQAVIAEERVEREELVGFLAGLDLGEAS